MNLIKSISVFGAGAWGTTIALLLARAGHRVALWCREESVARTIVQEHRNSRYLPEVLLPTSLTASAQMEEVMKGSEYIVFCIPTQSLREVSRLACPFLRGNEVIINLAKALEHDTFARPTQILQDEIRHCRVFATLSGPNIAQEVARGIPSKAVVSCTDFRELNNLRSIFNQEHFRVFTNPDLVGVELAAALKNVYAIVAGICDGLGYGENTKGALLSRSLAEMVEVGVRLGGNRNTFYGLAGMGDLFATATSPHSRNRRLGEALAKFGSLDLAVESLSGRVAEGVETARALKSVRENLKIETPIAEELYGILFDNRPCSEGFKRIWARSPDSEVA